MIGTFLQRAPTAIGLAVCLAGSASVPVAAQENATEREALLEAAREIITESRYAALITLDSAGAPAAREMDPFPPEDDMVIWFGTNRNSRKVRQIEGNPRVTIYYQAPGGTGYVSVEGTARLVDDPAALARRWKTEWEAFYPDREATYLLIEVRPVRLEVVNYRRGVVSADVAWAAPAVDLRQ